MVLAGCGCPHELRLVLTACGGVGEKACWVADGLISTLTLCRLKDEATLQTRQELPHNVQLKKILKDEELLRELKYLRLTNTGGFRR